MSREEPVLAIICEQYSLGEDDADLIRRVIAFTFGPQPPIRHAADVGPAEMAGFISQTDAVIVGCSQIGPKVLAASAAAREQGKPVFLAGPRVYGGVGFDGLTKFLVELFHPEATKETRTP
jgi:hypothetical protein